MSFSGFAAVFFRSIGVEEYRSIDDTFDYDKSLLSRNCGINVVDTALLCID